MHRDKCKTCVHNVAKDDPARNFFDCELYCYGAQNVKEDEDGMIYVTKCDDYEKG